VAEVVEREDLEPLEAPLTLLGVHREAGQRLLLSVVKALKGRSPEMADLLNMVVVEEREAQTLLERHPETTGVVL
jgi:hypothetical protein